MLNHASWCTNIRLDFGVLWSDGMYSGESIWFKMGIGEALPLVMIAILVCYGLTVGIQERDGHVLSIIIPHALLSHDVEYIVSIVCMCIELIC